MQIKRIITVGRDFASQLIPRPLSMESTGGIKMSWLALDAHGWSTISDSKILGKWKILLEGGPHMHTYRAICYVANITSSVDSFVDVKLYTKIGWTRKENICRQRRRFFRCNFYRNCQRKIVFVKNVLAQWLLANKSISRKYFHVLFISVPVRLYRVIRD